MSEPAIQSAGLQASGGGCAASRGMSVGRMKAPGRHYAGEAPGTAGQNRYLKPSRSARATHRQTKANGKCPHLTKRSSNSIAIQWIEVSNRRDPRRSGS